MDRINLIKALCIARSNYQLDFYVDEGQNNCLELGNLAFTHYAPGECGYGDLRLIAFNWVKEGREPPGAAVVNFGFGSKTRVVSGDYYRSYEKDEFYSTYPIYEAIPDDLLRDFGIPQAGSSTKGAVR